MAERIQFLFRLALCATITVAASCKPLPESPDIPADESLAGWLDTRMPELLTHFDVPGAAIAIMDDGQISLLRAYGFANTEEQTSMTTDHLFNVASISKLVTAWGVMRLAEQGRIDLDRPVNAYLERWQLSDGAGPADGVTVRRLLSHTAGISMPSTPGFRWPMDVPGLIEVLDGDYENSTYARAGTRVEVALPPGLQFRYSGGGYMILQLLIEDVSGQPFQAYMQEQILGPFGMRDSRFGWDPALAERMATPYLPSGSVEDIFRLPGQAASSLHTSGRDLASFMQASAVSNNELRNRVLSDEGFALMLEPNARADLGDAELAMMGLGYFLDKTSDVMVASHSGGNAGWRARMMVAPEKGDGLLVLTNSDNGDDLIEYMSVLWLRQQGIVDHRNE